MDNIIDCNMSIDSNDNILVTFMLSTNKLYSMRYDNSDKVWSSAYQIDSDSYYTDKFAISFDASDNPIFMTENYIYPGFQVLQSIHGLLQSS